MTCNFRGEHGHGNAGELKSSCLYNEGVNALVYRSKQSHWSIKSICR
jgi:hypothetical protein